MLLCITQKDPFSAANSRNMPPFSHELGYSRLSLVFLIFEY